MVSDIIVINNQNGIVRNKNKSNVLQYPQEPNKIEEPFKIQIVWQNVLMFIYLYLSALYGMYLVFTSFKKRTTVLAFLVAIIGGLGVTGGAHRLWAHRGYKAKWPAAVLLLIMQTLAVQNSVYEWVRDHRLHHKFTETNADPHNSMRGLFFSHVGWLLVRKHPDVTEKGKTISLNDLESDPLVMFQHRHYKKLVLLISIVIPTLIPYLCWGEKFINSYYSTIFRLMLELNVAWLVNSVAHEYGDKPYEKFMKPTNNKMVSFFTSGEGFHNYHHVFPWDYKASELGGYYLNGTTFMIELFAKLGWAYDLKTVPEELIKKRVLRTGDGSHILSRTDSKKSRGEQMVFKSKYDNAVWGWDDPDLDAIDRNATTIIKHI